MLSTRSLRAAIACCIVASSALPGRADEDIRFRRHLVPLLARLGCNAGNCHGAVQGQNGFRLSLFGVDPELDRQNLLREFGGRRLDFSDPDNSLFLLKAVGRVPHEGGVRLSASSDEYRLLRNWIAAGAPLDPAEPSKLTKLEGLPKQQTLKAGEKAALKLQATFSDGRTEDVTRFATFESNDREAAIVDENGVIEAKSVGSAAIVARFGAEPAVSLVVVPRQGAEPFPQLAATHFVDKHVVEQLRKLNIHPSEVCDDLTFLRRAYLDVAASLPSPEEVRAYVSDKSADKRTKLIERLLAHPGYSALWATRFSDILKASGYDGNFAFIEPAENRRFYEWVRARLSENTPYDQFVERILLATSREGRSQEAWLDEVQAMAEENSEAGSDMKTYAQRKTLDLYWQRKEATGIKGTLQVAHAFLGLRLECAQCHRHPHDVWLQDDLLSFANYFMRLRGSAYPDSKSLPTKYAAMMKSGPEEAKKLRAEAKKLTDKMKNKGISAEEMEFCKTESKKFEMRARALENGPKRFGTEIAISEKMNATASVSSPLGTQKSDKYRLLGEKDSAPVAKGEDPRKTVMDWMRRPDNPFFAKAIVNRVWAHYFGRGIIDPPDHLSPLNPPSHPELLQELTAKFIENKYDLKWLHRTILTSRTYQTSSTPNATNRSDRRHFAAFYVRRHSAEVLVDAINHATGVMEVFPAKLYLPPNAKAIEVAGTVKIEDETAAVAFAFQTFGRPLRNAQVQCDCERDPAATVVQTLYLSNHPKVREKIANPKGRVAQILEKIAGDDQRIDELYLWTLSRLPTEDEKRTCLAYLKESPTPRRGLEDVLWSLINTREFLLNH
ncbi:MAG: DUF1549 and DUF1553 domain-containing protein [Gemmataceae bacterium]